MRWFSTPPCIRMKVKRHDAKAGVLELAGPALGERVMGGVSAAVGASIAAAALRFGRLPLPLPFRLVPLVLGTAGAGLSAFGASAATAQHSIRVERGRGLSLRWRFGPGAPRTLELPAEQVEAFEVTRHTRTVSGPSSSTFESQRSEVFYRLVLVTRDGKDWALEEFGTETQARLRKEALEALLRSPGATRKKRSPARRPARKR